MHPPFWVIEFLLYYFYAFTAAPCGVVVRAADSFVAADIDLVGAALCQLG